MIKKCSEKIFAASLVFCILSGMSCMLLAHPERASAQTISCPFNGTGGDLIDRGFYITSFPNFTIGKVQMRYYTNGIAGAYTIRMTLRSGSFDGPVLATKTITADLTTGGTDVIFDFVSVYVPNGTTVTFSQSLVSGPVGGAAYFDTGTCLLGDQTCSTCPNVVETEGTTPPLSTFRRGSVGFIISSGPTTTAVPTMTEWGLIILTVLLGAGSVYYLRRRRLAI